MTNFEELLLCLIIFCTCFKDSNQQQCTFYKLVDVVDNLPSSAVTSCRYSTLIHSASDVFGEVSCARECSRRKECFYFQQRSDDSDHCQLCRFTNAEEDALSASPFTSFDNSKPVYQKQRNVTFYNTAVSWNEAKSRCESADDTNLLSLETEAKRQSVKYLYDKLPSTCRSYWVSLYGHQENGSRVFRWESGVKLADSSWSSKEPTGDGPCGELYRSFLINDRPCHTKLCYICEYERK